MCVGHAYACCVFQFQIIHFIENKSIGFWPSAMTCDVLWAAVCSRAMQGHCAPHCTKMELSDIWLCLLRTNTRPSSATFTTLGPKDRLEHHWVNLLLFKNSNNKKEVLHPSLKYFAQHIKLTFSRGVIFWKVSKASKNNLPQAQWGI